MEQFNPQWRYAEIDGFFIFHFLMKHQKVVMMHGKIIC